MTSIHNGASSHNGLSSAPQSSAPTWTRATTNFYPSHKRPFLCSWAHSKLPVSNCLLIRDAPVNRVITFGRLLQHDLDAAKSALPHGALLQHPGMVLKGGKGETPDPHRGPAGAYTLVCSSCPATSTPSIEISTSGDGIHSQGQQQGS